MTDASLNVEKSCVCVSVCAGMAGRHETKSRVWVPDLAHPVIRLMQQKS